MTEPITIEARLIRSMRRLPYMSPSRPADGVATAPASSVAVTTQAVPVAGASRSRGSSGTSGITSVCISETTIPVRASTTTTAFVLGGPGVREGAALALGTVQSLRLRKFEVGGRTLNQSVDLT